jgi:hypothetical protein
MRQMAHETRFHYSAVPRVLGGVNVAPGCNLMHEGQFLLLSDSGYGFHYEPGSGITIERPPGCDQIEEELWLRGSVYAAVACLNGLYPLHASAVAYQGQVYAFTGPSGAGKSTLIAGLGQRGWPMFCDDTLLLDLSDPARVIALPGHKRLKLTDHALELTGTVAQQPVGADTGKSYVVPPAGGVAQPLPLRALVFLEDGAPPAWSSIIGAERFARLADDHYTQDFYGLAQRPDREMLFALRARIARQVAMARLVRPRLVSGFGASLDLAEAQIRNFDKEQPAR